MLYTGFKAGNLVDHFITGISLRSRHPSTRSSSVVCIIAHEQKIGVTAPGKFRALEKDIIPTIFN